METLQKTKPKGFYLALLIVSLVTGIFWLYYEFEPLFKGVPFSDFFSFDPPNSIFINVASMLISFCTIIGAGMLIAGNKKGFPFLFACSFFGITYCVGYVIIFCKSKNSAFFNWENIVDAVFGIFMIFFFSKLLSGKENSEYSSRIKIILILISFIISCIMTFIIWERCAVDPSQL